MLLTVFCVPKGRAETTFALDVSPEFELRDFVALCELESGIPAAEIQVNRVIAADSETVSQIASPLAVSLLFNG